MVILDGCAMVQVVEGQASMLGYSFPRGTDVLVCSSSKLAEVITIEARHASRDERSGGAELMDVNMAEGREESEGLEDVLGCQLRFASHTLGQNILTSSVVTGKSLSFKLVNDSLAVCFTCLMSMVRWHCSATSTVSCSCVTDICLELVRCFSSSGCLYFVALFDMDVVLMAM